MIPLYKPSGKVGGLFIPAFLAGVVAVVALAFIYQLLLGFIPFIYINALLTAGVGILIATLVRVIVERGHVRNYMNANLAAIVLVLSLLGAKVFFQHRAWTAEVKNVLAKEGGFMPEQGLDLTIVDYIRIRAETGWSIGRGGQGVPLTGVFVYLIWLVEAGIMGYLALQGAKSALKPYSETSLQWANQIEQVMYLPVSGHDVLKQITSAQSVEDLLNIPVPKTDETSQFASYRVSSIPGNEMEDAFLDVVLDSFFVDKEGKLQKTERALVSNAILTRANREQLAENASLLKEALDAWRESVELEQAKTNHGLEDQASA